MDSGQVIKQWKQKTLQQVIQVVNADCDLKTGVEPAPGKKPVKIPATWFTADIKLGVRSNQVNYNL
jgi:hypothetical protein